ncbi:MAG: hypothetical protein ACI9OH_003504, partial [Oleispira sp.]
SVSLLAQTKEGITDTRAKLMICKDKRNICNP